MNEQTPGPVKATRSNEDFNESFYPLEPGDEPCPFTAIRSAKKTLICAHDLATMTEADALLLAAAYNAFDQVGRELNVDALKLALNVDLAEIIRYAIDYSQLQGPNSHNVGRLDQIASAKNFLEPIIKLLNHA